MLDCWQGSAVSAKKSVVPRVIVKLPGLKNRLGIERCTEQQTESKQRCLANNLTFDSIFFL
jgi:hypothetical protein